MMGVFKNRRVAILVSLICIVAFTILLLINNMSKRETSMEQNKYSSKAQTHKSLDEVVSLAIKGRSKGYGTFGTATEGHIILATEEKGGITKAYTIASIGVFGFENGIFTVVGGSGAISTVMTFTKNEKGEYTLKDYIEPMDGSGNLKSKKDMFPIRLWSMVLSEQKYYPELAKQQEEQARQYLKIIGRDAKVSAAPVEKRLPNINTEASNKLATEIKGHNLELNNFPYWIGTREVIQNGIRYTYETSQSKTEDNCDLIIYKKTKEDGSVIDVYKYKIVGNEPQLIN